MSKKTTTDVLSVLGPYTTDAELLEVADALEEHSDARATLIRLQIRAAAGAGNAVERKQINAMLKAEAETLLGPLAPFVKRDELTYAKGFLDDCVVKDVHPKHTEDLRAAFESPLVRRIRRLMAPMSVLVSEALVSLRHARLMGTSRDLALLGSPVEWEAFDAYVAGRDELDLLDRPSLLPRLEVLQCRGYIGCSVREVHEREICRRVTTFAMQNQHANHAGEFFETGESLTRRTTRLSFFWEPTFMVGKRPDFLVELSRVRDSEAAPWTRLEVLARFPGTMPHIRRGGTEWLEKAIASIGSFAPTAIALHVDGKKIDEIRSSLVAALTQKFGCAVEI